MKCEQDKASSVIRLKHRGAIGRELLFGLVAALACSLLWAIITHYSGRDLVVGTIVIGILVGVAVALSAKARSIDNGISAAGLTAIAVLLGKLIIVQWGLTAGLADNPAINIQQPASVVDTSQGEAVADATDQHDATTATANSSVPRIHASQMQDISKIKSALTMNDLLWLAGAVVVAFILGIATSKPRQKTPATSAQNQAEEKPVAEDTASS